MTDATADDPAIATLLDEAAQLVEAANAKLGEGPRYRRARRGVQ
jgi:hypothetical protein